MTDRDQFAAAALTGLLARRDCYDHEIAVLAWDMADAMLRCRAGADCPLPDNAPNHDAAPVPEHEWKSAYENMQRASLRLYAKIRDIADDVCGIGSGVTVSTHHAPEWLDAIASEYHRVRIELEQLRAKTNHDAAPAARASVESVAPQPTTRGDSGRTDKAAPRPSEGTGDTPDSPQPIACSVFDRSKPIASEQEPVAWGVADGKGLLATSIHRIDAVDMQSDYAYHTEIVPLYRSPALTDAERVAVEAAVGRSSRIGTEYAIIDAAVLRGFLERHRGVSE